MNEFQLVERYFTWPEADAVELGIGDDCALLKTAQDNLMAVSIDTLIEEVHFPRGAPANLVGQRALRVCLSDLAAMGAEPSCFTLSLTLPSANEDWLEDFSRGLREVAQRFDCALVGGDTCRGPVLSISIQVHGFVSSKRAFRRSGAKVGDDIYVTGFLGDGAAALVAVKGNQYGDDFYPYFENKFYKPEPRFKEAREFKHLIHSAIDLSDGLIADLGHICRASMLGAQLEEGGLPISPQAKTSFPKEQLLEWALKGGDDYELCFTAPKSTRANLLALADQNQFSVYRIGSMVKGSDVHYGNRSSSDFEAGGYRHF